MKITKTSLALFIALFIAFILLAAVPLTVTNFTQVHIDRLPQGGTATPRLISDNKGGPSQIAVFKDAGTPVWSLNDGGLISQTGSRDATTGYDYFSEISGQITGVVGGAKTYGLYIDMTRPAGYEQQSGDIDDAGIKVRVDTEAVTTTAGTTLRGIDAEAKADNPSGAGTNVYGASLTAKSDTGAGSVDSMIALQTNAQNNAAVVTNLMSADFRLMRQAATVPTNEFGIQVRSSSTTGAGADAAIFLSSDYAGSATTDSFDYGLDVSGAAINTADIRLENGETISNQTDTAIQIGGFLAFEEGTVQDLGATFTIAPTASYQPITNSTGGSVTSSATTAIADGAIAGTILVVCNEDAQDMVLKDNANTLIGGDQTLTGGAMDCLTMIWNGADWQAIAPLANN